MPAPVPTDPQYALAVAHHRAGRLAEAESLYRQILHLHPTHPDALHMLGVARHQLGDHASAEQFIRQAIAHNPHSAMYLGNLASALSAQGKYDQAIETLQRAIQLNPALPILHYNLGVALLHSNEPHDAIRSFQQALALRGDYPEAHNNLGNALRAAGRLDEALAAHQQALALRPHYPEAQLNVGMVLLLQGRLAEGWPAYEARWEVNRLSPSRGFSQPTWNGSPLGGQRILLHAEQGFGDTIQMIRYAPLVAARGGRVLIECPPPLNRLLSNLPHIEQVFAEGESLPPFEVHCPIMSLPRVFGTTLQSIPPTVPYLHADPILIRQWQSRIPRDSKQLEVGLVWSGKPYPPGRSIPPDLLTRLGSVPHVRFHSLQPREQTLASPFLALNFPIHDHAPHLTDFADTAALLSNLDLLITIDTAAAHLAGAMGKPAWVLLPCSPDWRWLLARPDSPWYPTLRLFRQPAPGQWDPPLDQVHRALRDLAGRIE